MVTVVPFRNGYGLRKRWGEMKGYLRGKGHKGDFSCFTLFGLLQEFICTLPCTLKNYLKNNKSKVGVSTLVIVQQP